MRPNQLVGVLGTHTEVGKTFITSRWLSTLKQSGVSVSARKPVQSFAISDGTTDAAQLSAATGEPVEIVCPHHRCYALALAPPMAADQLHLPPIYLRDLCEEINWQTPSDIGVIETVGGPLSPIAHDGDSIDLLRQVSVDHILLVADARLGALNSVRLALLSIDSIPVTVFLNRFDAEDELHLLNLRWLTERYGIRTVCDVDQLTAAITS